MKAQRAERYDRAGCGSGWNAFQKLAQDVAANLGVVDAGVQPAGKFAVEREPLAQLLEHDAGLRMSKFAYFHFDQVEGQLINVSSIEFII